MSTAMSGEGDEKERSVLAGLLVDLSGSMKRALITSGQRMSRSDGAFTALKTMCRVGHEAGAQNNIVVDVFAVGVGVRNTEDDSDITDLFDLFRAKHRLFAGWEKEHLAEMLTDYFGGRGENAAYWVDKYVTPEEAAPLAAFALNPANKKVVDDFLKSLPGSMATGFHKWGTEPDSPFKKMVYELASGMADDGEREIAMKDRFVREQMTAWDGFVPERPHIKAEVAVTHVDTAAAILDMTDDELKHFAGAAYPYIYRGTPLLAGLRRAFDIFHTRAEGERYLFVVSDGMPSDGSADEVRELAEELKGMGVIIIACFFTDKEVRMPKYLFNTGMGILSREEQLVFDICSPGFRYTDLPVALLLRRGWSMSSSGECRLFFRTNSLDVMNEFSDIVQSCLVGDRISIDAALSVTSAFRWEEYVAAARADMRVENQGINPTCWAHAIAIVIHHASKRVEGRDAKSFAVIRDECYDLLLGGREERHMRGFITEEALKRVLPRYRLQYRKVTEREARWAVMRGRPVVATFSLYKHPDSTPREAWDTHPEEWNKFYQFAPRFADGEAMQKEDVLNERRAEGAHLAGHAVVLVEVRPECLVFQNSWGGMWGMSGHFKIKNHRVLRDMKFFDIMFTTADLTEDEKRRWEVSNREKLATLMRTNQALARALLR